MAVSEDGAPVIDPMYQFQIKPLFGGGEVGSFITITNSTLWLAISIAKVVDQQRVLVGHEVQIAGVARRDDRLAQRHCLQNRDWHSLPQRCLNIHV